VTTTKSKQSEALAEHQNGYLTTDIEEVALAVARELVVYRKRPGGQEQFSEPLKFQMASTSRFADLPAWISGHLEAEQSVRGISGNRGFEKVGNGIGQCKSPRQNEAH
jgi:hypothetical protein